MGGGFYGDKYCLCGSERSAREGGQSRTAGGPVPVASPLPPFTPSLICVHTPSVYAPSVPVFCLRVVWPTSFR
jgi:hypothetical protein